MNFLPSKAETPSPVFDDRPEPRAEHCGEPEYSAFLELLPVSGHHRQMRLLWRRRFATRWPDLRDWLREPLVHRLGRRPGEHYKSASHLISYRGHSYLVYLSLTNRVRLDYPFLLGLGALCANEVAPLLGIDWKTTLLERIGEGMGFKRERVSLALGWAVPRIALHTGVRDVTQWSDQQLDELDQAIQAFRDHPVSIRCGDRACNVIWPGHMHVLRTLLRHRGNAVRLPLRRKPVRTCLRFGPASLRTPAERWLALKAAGWSFRTTAHERHSLNYFLEHLAKKAPAVTKYSQLTPSHAADFVTALTTDTGRRTGRPLSILARRKRLSCVAAFLRDGATWGWPDMPARQLLDLGALPRIPGHVPRYIPGDELEKLMGAIRNLKCPFQRAALLTARWSGARRDEIVRLSLDCLDSYPDGTPRLRIPPGKTYRERMVPLHEEAAEALRTLIDRRQNAHDRPIVDRRTHSPVRYVFLRRGHPMSAAYLFELSLRIACCSAGLADPNGKPMITAHRFRHTVGTQLAERGAKLHTIMSVLGHESPHMSMVYSRISDAEVLRDYQSVLAPGAPLAGAGAEIIRAGTLTGSDIDWLQSNFFKTALELGHCLRLPSEGPCECDLYLTCAKFVTTPKYAPRLRERHELELKLAQDARQRGWSREVERHCAIAKRVACLLKDLGEPMPAP
jgi:integrase